MNFAKQAGLASCPEAAQALFANRRELYAALIFSIFENLWRGVPLVVIVLALTELLRGGGDARDIMFWAACLIGGGGLQALCSVQAHVRAGCFSFGLGEALRLALGKHLQKIPLGALYSERMGHRMETMLFDVSNIENILVQMYGKGAACILIALLVGIGMICFDPALGLCLVGTVPPAFGYLWLLRRVIDVRSAAALEARRSAAAKMLEYARGIRTIRSLNLAGRSFASLDEALSRLQRRSVRLEAGMLPLMELYSAIAMLGSVFVVLYGTSRHLDATLPLASLLAFLVISLRFYLPVSGIGGSFAFLRYLAQSGRNIGEVLSIPEQAEGREYLPSGPLDVEFRNVYFSYAGKTAGASGREVLRGISFTVPAGQTAALVGPSGAGKSTIINLLARLWDVDGGQVLIGDRDVRELRAEALHGAEALVLQDVHFFSGSIADNLRAARPDATDATLLHALDAACCDFVHRLPQGMQTPVGECATRLSGGERRRLAVARAMLRDAPVIVLDEATASLDPENEYKMQRAFERLAKGRTLLIIAHRLATVVRADRIFFLEDGRIAEAGTHAALLALDGRYAAFWRLQQKAYGWEMRRG